MRYTVALVLIKITMKNTFKLILIIFTGQLLTSCSDLDKDKQENLSIESDFMPIEINDEYKISVPKYMKKANGLNDEASLQYQNIYKETYVVIIDESKEELVSTFQELGEYNDSISVVKNYRDIQLQLLSENINISMKSDPKSAQINGLDAEFVEIDGQVEGVNFEIAYFLTFIEGKEKVYMVMVWTLKEKKEKYKITFEQIAKSFKLLVDNQSTTE
jgi:hypothetical protein